MADEQNTPEPTQAPVFMPNPDMIGKGAPPQMDVPEVQPLDENPNKDVLIKLAEEEKQLQATQDKSTIDAQQENTDTKS